MSKIEAGRDYTIDEGGAVIRVRVVRIWGRGRNYWLSLVRADGSTHAMRVKWFRLAIDRAKVLG